MRWQKYLSNLLLGLLIVILLVLGVTYYQAWNALRNRPKVLSKVIRTMVFPVSQANTQDSRPETERMEFYIQTETIQCKTPAQKMYLCIPRDENKSHIQLLDQCSKDLHLEPLEGECTVEGFKPTPLVISIPFPLIEPLAEEVKKGKVKVVYELLEDEESHRRKYRMKDVQIEDMHYFTYFKKIKFFEK